MKARLVGGNRVELLEAGAEYFPALLAAIDGAQGEIHLQTYIFADDDTGRRVGAALARAARRGVAVRVLVDGFGAPGFDGGLGRSLRADGVEVLIYRPELARFRLRRHRLRRMHRKVAVIDGRIAFIGGINVIDDADPAADSMGRYDHAVRVEGPVLGAVHASTRHLWQIVRWATFGRRYLEPSRRAPDDTPQGDVRAAFLVRDNLRHRRDIEEAYLDAIASARREIVIANAYFFPGRRFRHALAEAARRGVQVTLLLQGRVEYRLQHFASQALHGSMLHSGVRIFEYRPSFLHAKVAVVDGLWSTVGSSNIEPFSLLLAREANLVVHDARFAARLRASLQRAMDEGAREIRAADWMHAPWSVRVARWLAYGMARLLLGITGYDNPDYRR